MDKTYQEDPRVSNDFLQANMDSDLFAKCRETYSRYPTYARGGPLLLCIALHRMTSLAQPAMEPLKKTLVNYKISSLAGEDDTKATNVIKASLSIS